MTVVVVITTLVAAALFLVVILYLKFVFIRPRTLLKEVAEAYAVPEDVLKTLLTTRETRETVVDLVRNPRSSSIINEFAQLYDIPTDVVVALTREAVRRPLVDIVRAINLFYESRRFLATRNFTIGSTNTRVAEGDVVEWDGGNHVLINGETHEAVVQGAIREGWLIPEEPSRPSPQEAIHNLARYAAMMPLLPEDSPEPNDHRPYTRRPDDPEGVEGRLSLVEALVNRDRGSGITNLSPRTLEALRETGGLKREAVVQAPQAEPPRPDPPSAWDRLLEDE